MQEDADGSLLLTLRVNHLLEVKRWAMYWGPDCQVLEPMELRAEVRDDAKRIIDLYGNA
jgi:predicted DNA-binding transcriptional regulator YafY